MAVGSDDRELFPLRDCRGFFDLKTIRKTNVAMEHSPLFDFIGIEGIHTGRTDQLEPVIDCREYECYAQSVGPGIRQPSVVLFGIFSSTNDPVLEIS